MTDSTNAEIDMDHPITDAFRAVGYSDDDLVDPGYVTADDIEEGDWTAVVWQSHGIEMFDIPADAVEYDDWSPAGVSVVRQPRDTQQPIAFADDSGPLNDDIPPMEKLRGQSSAKVTFLAGPNAERQPPEYDREEAVRALSFWGSEGWIPREGAEGMAAAFDATVDRVHFKDDDDVEGGEIARAPGVAASLAATTTQGTRQSDTDITGLKKRRRQKFYRNLEVLKDAVGIGDE